ncbi:MAG: AlpA family phage regulatory protein [Proteobacteria bacterium]|nr:AlpA family phage regulatory protein [Pseudomonadota bacterium]
MSDYPHAMVEPPADPRHRAPLQPNALPRYLRLHELQQIVPYSHMHFYRLERDGKFPTRIKFGPGRVVWDTEQVMAWVDARRAESGAEPLK